MQENNNRVTLLQFVESKFDALEKQWAAEGKANSEARDLAAEILNVRLEHMNNFRSDCERYREGFEKELRPLREWQAVMEGKASQRSVYTVLAISIIGLGLALWQVLGG